MFCNHAFCHPLLKFTAFVCTLWRKPIDSNVIFLCCVFATAFLSNTSFAADIYKYKDAKGRWVYTDKKPKTKDYSKQKMLVTELSRKVSVVNRGSQQKPMLYAVNQLAGPAQVWLDFRVQENILLHPKSDLEWQLNSAGEVFLTYISPKIDGRSWAYEWVPNYVEGVPVKKDDLDSTPIPPPFSQGEYIISQSFHGKASHSQHQESFFAVDIHMPESTPISAVREGIVMDVERDFSRSGWHEAVADEANYVRVLHSDGSMALYAHLKPDSIQVSLGQTVRVGQVMAESGNTGFSTGPHLHFVIQYNAGRALKSWPFQFKGFGRAPEAGDVLRP